MTRAETRTEPANYFIRELPGETKAAITAFKDPHPQITAAERMFVTYPRKDGVTLSGTIYLPPGYTKGQRVPMLMWAYPREFVDAAAASQVVGSPNRFTTVGGSSHLLLLAHGYAIFDGPTMPIVGPGETANDTYVDQLVSSAEAAVNKAVELGIADRHRIGVGGHSYGAFMTANLLAHSDLFAAGVARSGAYNRSLTPFGFQAERRTFWEIPEIYGRMSPFFNAHKINEPILLIHGEADDNSGTFPIQSAALHGAQGTRGDGPIRDAAQRSARLCGTGVSLPYRHRDAELAGQIREERQAAEGDRLGRSMSSQTTTGLVTLDAIREAAARIEPLARVTPLVDVSHAAGRPLFLKCENLQPAGAFKIRGAYNMVAQLTPDQRARGVITYSSGNHGQAMALAARELGAPAVVVMPTTAPAIKVEGARSYGAEVIFAGTTSSDRRQRAEAEAAARGLTMVPPFDHEWIIAGQGTLGLELLEQCPDMAAVVVPIGGGGLAAGVAAAIKQTRPAVKVIGVEPAGAAKMRASLDAGHPVTLSSTATIADGLMPVRPGDLTFAHARRFIDRVITVDDPAIAEAVLWIFAHAKIVAEPSGAATTAAVRSGA